MAKCLFWFCLSVMVAAWAVGGGGDLILWLVWGVPATITAYLRANPWYAIVPIAVMQLFLIWFVYHLWFEPR